MEEIKLQIKDAEHELKTLEENIKNATAQLEMERFKVLQKQPLVKQKLDEIARLNNEIALSKSQL